MELVNLQMYILDDTWFRKLPCYQERLTWRIGCRMNFRTWQHKNSQIKNYQNWIHISDNSHCLGAWLHEPIHTCYWLSRHVYSTFIGFSTSWSAFKSWVFFFHAVFVHVSGVKPVSELRFIPHIYEYGEPWCNDIGGEDQKNQRKPCFSATLYATNPTWTDPGINSGLCGERLVANRLSRGMAFVMYWFNSVSEHRALHVH